MNPFASIRDYIRNNRPKDIVVVYDKDHFLDFITLVMGYLFEVLSHDDTIEIVLWEFGSIDKFHEYLAHRTTRESQTVHLVVDIKSNLHLWKQAVMHAEDDEFSYDILKLRVSAFLV